METVPAALVPLQPLVVVHWAKISTSGTVTYIYMAPCPIMLIHTDMETTKPTTYHYSPLQFTITETPILHQIQATMLPHPTLGGSPFLFPLVISTATTITTTMTYMVQVLQIFPTLISTPIQTYLHLSPRFRPHFRSFIFPSFLPLVSERSWNVAKVSVSWASS